MKSRLGVKIFLVVTCLTCALSVSVGAQELSAKEHFEIGERFLSQDSRAMDASSPQFGNAIAHIKTAVASGLDYEQAGRANFLLSKYASDNLTSKEYFELGKSLIEANHYDSMGATQSGMVEGMRQMREAIRLNYSDLKSAYLVLANAYDQWPEQPKENSEAEKIRVAERNQILRHLYQLYPDDLEVLDLYANRTSDRKEKILVYRHMLELNPKLPDPHFMLGLFYIEDGKFGAGIAESRQSIELEIDPSEISNRAGRIAEAVVAQGCTLPEGDEWGSRMMAVEDDLDIGIHSKEEVNRARLRFAYIKKNFLIALEKVICPAIN